MAMMIIDYQHLVYKTLSPNIPVLSATVEEDGIMKQVFTTIPSFTIKSVWNYSGRGSMRCAICLEGGSATRENHFSALGQSYKGGRKKLNPQMRKGIDLSVNLMVEGKVSCYRQAGFESDDFVYTLVQAAKQNGYTEPIYVVTNDHDLMPLVDNQVSVYMRASRTFAIGGAPELKGYFQITPESWDDFVLYSSRYGKNGNKGYDVPYNSVLLYKMLRGDDSDNISGLKGFGAVKYNKVIQRMRDDNVAFESIFRYENEWEDIKDVIKPYFTEIEMTHMHGVYDGIRLRHTMPLDEVKLPSVIQYGLLSKALLRYQINIAEPK